MATINYAWCDGNYKIQANTYGNRKLLATFKLIVGATKNILVFVSKDAKIPIFQFTLTAGNGGIDNVSEFIEDADTRLTANGATVKLIKLGQTLYPKEVRYFQTATTVVGTRVGFIPLLKKIMYKWYFVEIAAGADAASFHVNVVDGTFTLPTAKKFETRDNMDTSNDMDNNNSYLLEEQIEIEEKITGGEFDDNDDNDDLFDE